MINFLQAIVMGLLQGLTEFFPVSSSTHLKLSKFFLHIQESPSSLLFDLFCHFGTLLAVVYFLRRDIHHLLYKDRKKLGLFVIALCPLIPAYFLLKPIRMMASQWSFLGATLIGTSLILFAAQSLSFRRIFPKKMTKGHYRHAVFIGAMQAMALIPGISRSASTISAAHLLGWTWEEAVRFSFMLSIPTILGGNCLELLSSWPPSESISHELVMGGAGLVAAFGAGLLVIRFAFAWLSMGKVRPFAWYCLVLGILVTAYFNGISTS